MPKPAIEAAQITFAYPPLAPELPAMALFEALTCRLDTGESLTVLGASDSGKSALCYLLAGLAP
ncbi:MAG: ABC transporter, partial [Chloroflexota bacterium]|nr:ABC transporter [Chloroflexota bacterium]